MLSSTQDKCLNMKHESQKQPEAKKKKKNFTGLFEPNKKANTFC